MKRIYFLFILISSLFSSINSLAQGGELLIQQYSKGPQLDQNYSKWTIKLGPQLNRLNTDLGTTSPTLTIGGLVEIEYKLSKTVGLKTGSQFTPIAYRFAVGDSIGQDHLKYLSLPLILKLQPTKKVSFGLGLLYHYFLEGERRITFEESRVTTPYTEGKFKNSFGGIAQITYHIHPRISLFTNFRWIKRSSPATQAQTNNTSGFQMGISFQVWKSIPRP